MELLSLPVIGNTNDIWMFIRALPHGVQIWAEGSLNGGGNTCSKRERLTRSVQHPYITCICLLMSYK